MVILSSGGIYGHSRVRALVGALGDAPRRETRSEEGVEEAVDDRPVAILHLDVRDRAELAVVYQAKEWHVADLLDGIVGKEDRSDDDGEGLSLEVQLAEGRVDLIDASLASLSAESVGRRGGVEAVAFFFGL